MKKRKKKKTSGTAKGKKVKGGDEGIGPEVHREWRKRTKGRKAKERPKKKKKQSNLSNPVRVVRERPGKSFWGSKMGR